MTDQTRDYRETLFLPKTDFPMRAGLPKKEPQWLKRWDDIKLFEQQQKQNKDEEREPWILHDGPPYANGHIHMGTAMNKILKDIISRSHQMLGYGTHYVPGWDCHGLPIEWKVEEEFRGKGRTKDQVPPAEFRERCREYAGEWLDIQREEFKRLGVVGEWDNPYKTMNFQSEADICGELLKIAKTGQLYRGSKPVMWSPVEQTALAEAEVEYADRKATQIYVKFPVKSWSMNNTANEADMAVIVELAEQMRDASVVIWTTTPWTIPANRAVSYSSKITYGLYEITEMEESEFEPWSKPGDKLIVADDLWEVVAKAGLVKSAERLNEIDFCNIDMQLFHPLRNMVDAEGKFDFPVPMLEGDHVTAEAGTGFVHTAPSHGEDDYVVWISNQTKLEQIEGVDTVVPMTMDDAGCYTDIMPERFVGLDVIRTSGKKRGQDGKANPEVLKALVECGNLLARGITMLRDAHSWRSKAPVIRRATPQWFISMSKEGLRDKAIAAINETTWFPERSVNRITAMVNDRPDWLISRQRAWGVPITLIVHEDGRLHTERDDADQINSRILAAVEEHGVDGWFDAPLEELMPNDNEGWIKVTDILDVWFDSGCTHAFCLKRRDDLPDRANLYLEGSDQHRGWFQSSLLESCAVYGEAPYDAVLTHGFVVDNKGLKMSKSLGNTMSPEDISRQYGAEVMRLWTASSDFTNDLKIGKEIIQTNVDSYRKMRNTLRYMIGALDGFEKTEKLPYAEMPALEKWVLHRLLEVSNEFHNCVEVHDYKRIFSMLFNFFTVDLSAFYFDIRKDALYCDPLDSTRRRACRTVMDHLFRALTTWLAPIMCFTMEEVWQSRFPSEKDSVHLKTFYKADPDWLDSDLAENMNKIREFRTSVYEVLEPMRGAKDIGSSLEVNITASTDAATVDAVKALGLNAGAMPANPTDSLADYLIISECTATVSDPKLTVEILSEKDGWAKCERSWKYFQPSKGETITPRDAAAVATWDAENA